ncbi:DUF58 domain-containing protein [Methylomonas albis]|uniref:DUF58 domain-containing protein n=1 Tax=Methylomonas albis TaxID=1854563 RepID=A0ABR9CYR1_9GAMM|nr:DUF58 domain-containing protein [Methylomonas albis]MBD9355860.1 DUF58 domain-containing protein [Methylomonas albis]
MALRLKFLILCGFTLTAYLAAISREQSLPWLLAALLSAALLTGMFWPHWLLQRLSVRRVGPQRALEGETIVFRVDLQNRGWLPRFMVELVDRLPFVGAAEQGANDGDKLLGSVAYVPGRGARSFDVPLQCEKRGFYKLGPMGLASSFPLGLAEARSRADRSLQTLTIYPKVFPILSLPLFGAPSQIHRGGYCLPEGAGAAEFSGLREYRRGDNPRHIHWPTTARLNELMVKEFEPLASACICIALDLGRDANIGQGKHSTVEYAIRIAASVAGYACSQNMHSRLLADAKRPLHILSGKGDFHYQTILDALAVVDADGNTPYATLLTEIALNCVRGETVLLLLAEPPHRNAATLQALALLRAKGVYLFAVIFERASFFASANGGKTRMDDQKLAAGLTELGAHCLTVRRGDDLTVLFNQ